MKILYFFLLLWVIFALLDPHPDPSTQINADPCGSGSATQVFLHANIFKVGNRSKNIPQTGNQIYLWIFASFHAPRSGSVFPIRILIRIQNSQINADPDPQHCLKWQLSRHNKYELIRNDEWRRTIYKELPSCITVLKRKGDERRTKRGRGMRGKRGCKK